MAVSLRVMIAGGGTGGHVFPMIAVADALRSKTAQSEVVFIGTKRGIESRLVPEAGYGLRTLKVGGLQGKSPLVLLRSLLQLPIALIKSAFMIAKFGPHVVVGGGGYASWPLCRAASMLGAPVVLLEVNSLPGLANRKLAPLAKEAYIAFPATAERMKCRCFLTGNPIRRLVRGKPPAADQKELRILVLGGSQGAIGLNTLVMDSLPHLKKSGMELYITHQSGRNDYERVEKAYRDSGVAGKVVAFIPEIWNAYRNADVVVCRAGATTVAELIAARRPSVLVPLPSAAENHQELNAREIVDAGGGVLLRQDEADGEALADLLDGWYHQRDQLIRMGAALEVLDHPEAADTIAERIIALVEERKND